MKRKKKLWIRLAVSGVAVLLIVALVLSQTVMRGGIQISTYSTGFSTYSGGYAEGYTIDFADDRAAFTITTPNGYTWSNEVEQAFREALSANNDWRTYMQSLISVNCYDSSRTAVETSRTHCNSSNVSLTTKNITNGRSYTFRFRSLSLTVQVDVTFEKGRLSVRIPADKIVEDGKFRLMSIEVMPFFGAADHTTDGYILYPDGCGALMMYENTNQRPATKNVHTLEIFGSSEMQSASQVLGPARLPVFGIKNNNNAVLGAVVTGAAESFINISPEGLVVNANRAAFEVKYRSFYTVPASNLITGGKKDSVTIKADRDRHNQDFEAIYLFTDGETANYAGMATAYRNFLEANNLVHQNTYGKDVSMSVEFFMGTMEQQMLFDQEVVTTTFDQVGTFAAELKEEGVNALSIRLTGWEKKGVGANRKGADVWSSLGGVGELKKLKEALNALNFPLFLYKNFVEVKSTDTGYVVDENVVYSGNGFVVSNESGTLFLLNKSTQKAYYDAFKKKLPISSGVLVDGIGSILSSDYGSNSRYTRTQAMEIAQEIAADGAKGEGVSVVDGNAYMLPYATMVTDVPDRSSRFYIFDKEVPFYQMVLHGNVMYTGDAINLFYDTEGQLLKQLEYGYTPYFCLIGGTTDLLKYTESSELFSANYSRWKADLIELYNEIQAFSAVQGSAMVGHESDGVHSRVEYENGWSLLVNYSEETWIENGVQVEAKGYVLCPPAA